jgi:hypothetical protein
VEKQMSVLRTLFGPSKEEIWRQFCAQTGASLIEGSRWWEGSKVEARHGEWTVTLDTYAVYTGKATATFTRMRAPYVNPDGFTFGICRQGFLLTMCKWMVRQDVSVGYPEFDEAFIIQGNDESKLRRLFSNGKIRELISVQRDISFSVRDLDREFWGKSFPEGVSELYFERVGVIKDVERLKLLYELFSETLDELCRMDSACENDPQVKV